MVAGRSRKFGLALLGLVMMVGIVASVHADDAVTPELNRVAIDTVWVLMAAFLVLVGHFFNNSNVLILLYIYPLSYYSHTSGGPSDFDNFARNVFSWYSPKAPTINTIRVVITQNKVVPFRNKVWIVNTISKKGIVSATEVNRNA